METVQNLNENTVESIKELVTINRDSAQGFREVADAVSNDDVAKMFREFAQQRDGFAAELAGKLLLNAEEPPKSGKLTATLHRWWIEARSLVQSDNTHAMLAEAERGEDRIKECYEEVLKDCPGNALSDVLHEQCRKVKSAHDRVRAMRDATR